MSNSILIPDHGENKDGGLHQPNPMFLTWTIKMSKPTVNGRLIGPEISGEMGLAVWEGSRKRASLGMAWKPLPPFSTKRSKGSLLPPVFSKRKSLIVSSGDELPS